MKTAILVFPGSNREGDAARAIAEITGSRPIMVWHRDSELPKVDLVVVPGGFSYGDYLRCGAIAANSPILREVKATAAKGTAVLGIWFTDFGAGAGAQVGVAPGRVALSGRF